MERSGELMDIYQILHNEHVQLLQALERLKVAHGQNRKTILDMVADELTAHSDAEEQILYDRLSQVTQAHDIVLEAKEEHYLATRVLEELMTMRSEDERFAAKAKVLMDLIKHHVEEEETELWREAKATFDPVVAENFGGEYLAKKNEQLNRPILLRLGKTHAKKVAENVGHVFSPQGPK